ncbi:hypothetical protein NKH33_30695 [Mesorhizobium sp. M1182]|uniref:hypothetical protein n=1 Tax=unclassified Mesorhizobium TaxID=325217 RepID=UPI003337C59F
MASWDGDVSEIASAPRRALAPEQRRDPGVTAAARLQGVALLRGHDQVFAFDAAVARLGVGLRRIRISQDAMDVASFGDMILSRSQALVRRIGTPELILPRIRPDLEEEY